MITTEFHSKMIRYYSHFLEKDCNKIINEKDILEMKINLIKGMLNPGFTFCLDFFEKEIFKTAIGFKSKEMEMVDNDYKKAKEELTLDFKYKMYNSLFKKKQSLGYVYLIENKITKLTKIGVSTSPERRKKKLELSSGVKLDILRVHSCDHSFHLESFLHLSFSNKRALGEWFKLSGSNVEEIENFFNNIKNLEK